MSIIILLIVASLSVALMFLGAFLWAVKTDQFEDTVTPAIRILHDDVEIFKNV
jgi:cbb3-type cytochrome oxidase maturation protein